MGRCMGSDPSEQESTRIHEEYRRRERVAEGRIKDLERQINQISNMRLIVATMLIAALFALWQNVGSWVIPVSATLVLCFAVLVGVHEQLKRRVAEQQAIADLNRQAISRLKRDWSALPEPPKLPQAPNRLLTDLDIIGRGSLCQLLSTLATPLAWQRFFKDILHPNSAHKHMERQGAVAALVPVLSHRQRLYLAAAEIRGDGTVENHLLQWAAAGENKDEIPPSWVVIALTTAMVVTFTAVTVVGIPIITIGVVLALNILVNLIYLPRIHQSLESLEQSGAVLRRYERMIDVLLTGNLDEVYLHRLLAPFHGVTSATSEIRRLQRLVELADLRNAGLIYLILQSFTMWSFHIFFRLREWRRHFGTEVSVWMEALAEYELLATLAGLHYDNPSWCFPTIEMEHSGISATALGHPLIVDGVRIANDIRLGNIDQPLLFVTGSNMSGKSTLLRTLGINILLSRMGGPVCAQRLVMPIVTLATCFNVQDALVAGRSLFMAELSCIRVAVDTLESARPTEGHLPVFLFDEILRGTNSVDRRIAVTAILHRLLAAGAVGVIATHDLELANKQLLQEWSRSVYFEDQIRIIDGKPSLQFDYRLREGITTTSNALMLLKAVGIDPSVTNKNK